VNGGEEGVWIERLSEATKCALFLGRLDEPSVQATAGDDGGHTHGSLAHFTQKIDSAHLRHIRIGHDAAGIAFLDCV